jgi:LysR family glycine cleavage system transcriptional activator
MRRYRVPSSSALVAFESAARHCNFREAAEELHTSQSAISRHVKTLEEYLGAELFEREGRRLELSLDGRRFQRAVVSALENIQSAAREIAADRSPEQVIVACSHEISHLYLMPRFEAVQAALGPHADVRIMTVEYELQDALSGRDVDVCFTYHPELASGPNLHRLFHEEVRPVCAPAFLERHASMLEGPVDQWRGLAFLELSRANYGWATWDDWFRHNGLGVPPEARFEQVRNYVYLLEAAAAGRGLALGWTGLIERYLDSGMLVDLQPHATRTGGGFFARVSPGSEDKQAVRDFVAFLAGGEPRQK